MSLEEVLPFVVHFHRAGEAFLPMAQEYLGTFWGTLEYECQRDPMSVRRKFIDDSVIECKAEALVNPVACSLPQERLEFSGVQ